MDKDIKNLQGPRHQSPQGAFTSGFDSDLTPMVPPPAMQLSANPAEGDHGNGGGEQVDYEPETVVFDIGGFADPQDPSKGDAGKGIKVVVPPGLDSPAALVHVAMAMMRLTESEAVAMIAEEGLQWIDYRPEGHGTDRQGNVIHLMRFKPKYAERVAHEPTTLRPTEGDDLLAYKQFKLYLADHEGDNVRDPYGQYDRMAMEQGWHVGNVQPQLGGGTMPGSYNSADVQDRRIYEDERESVVQYVVWERLRAKRESLASGVAEQKTDLKSTVERLADTFPAIVDVGVLQYYMPTRYYHAWAGLHAQMILAQGELEKGDASAMQGGATGDKVFQLAYWFAEHANERFGVWSSGKKEYHKFNEDDVLETHRLAIAKEFGLEQGRQLLYLHYKLTFAIMEVAGRSIAHGTGKTMLNPHGDAGLNLQGRQVENQGKAGTVMLDLMHSHPAAKRVHATFYPEEETKDFRQGGERQGGDDWSQGIPLDLCLWHDTGENEWVLEDFSDIADRKENRAGGNADGPVPSALFDQLNSKLRFPKGALYYRVPDEGSYRIMRTTEPTTVADWLRYVALAGLAVGMALATGGASIPAQVVMVGSALAMAGAEGFEMHDEAEHGMLTTEKVMIHGAMIASCVLGGASGALGMAAKAGRLGAWGTKVARVVAGLQVGADGVCVAVFTQEAFEGLKAAADDPEGLTFTRLLGFFLQMGMNGLMLYGMRGSMLEAVGAEARGLHGGAKEPRAPKPRKDRAAAIGALREEKTTLEDEFNQYWRDEGVAGFLPMVATDMNTLGALGSLPKGISVPNYRRLFGIVGRMARNGIELTVESVLLRLEKIGMQVRDLVGTDRNIIELCIQDVNRADLTAEEIAFIDSYHLNVEGSELTNYELRELHARGYTVSPETGKLTAPSGRTVDFSHAMLSPELRTKLVNFEKRIDFSAYPDLVELAEIRQRQRELVADMRKEIKARKARGETIPEAEIAAFNKATSKIGVMSEEIAEKSLQKYLDGEGFIQVYPLEGAPSSKSGDFDRIYMRQDGDRYQVFEVKGGVSEIGDRLINNVEGVKKGSVAQQGTLPYLKQIIFDMKLKSESAAMGKSLENAQFRGKIDYLYYRQGFTESGALKNPEIGQFDIREL